MANMRLLRLMFLFLLRGTSGLEDTHVFAVHGEDVTLPYNGTISDCNATKWYHNRYGDRMPFTLFPGVGRQSLASDCSLNIRNITEEDCGVYTGLIRQKEEKYTYVFLHVLYVLPSSKHTKIGPGRSSTLICHLYSYDNFCCDRLVEMEKIQLIWVNQDGISLQTDPRFQIISLGQFSSILTTTLLNEDNNTEWTCQVIKGNAVKASTSFTVKYLAPDTPPLNINTSHSQRCSSPESSLPLTRVIIILGEIAALTAPTVILLQIMCER